MTFSIAPILISSKGVGRWVGLGDLNLNLVIAQAKLEPTSFRSTCKVNDKVEVQSKIKVKLKI